MQVRDTGPGIAPEIRDWLFRPFATAGKPNGVGLVLAIARQFVIDQIQKRGGVNLAGGHPPE